MEHAAAALSKEILSQWDSSETDYRDVVLICGKGNNGADGLACARILYGKIPVRIFCPVLPETEDGKPQVIMCQKLGIPFISEKKLFSELKDGEDRIIVDCLYGTGFHGELSTENKKLLDLANNSKGYKIACDIPSALYFNANLTVTMGTLKTQLFSEEAKSVSGKIIVADLGISSIFFERNTESSSKIYYIEETDIHLPYRTEKVSHKGTYGHSVIFAGEKSGAAVLSGEAALNFGSGLTTLLHSNFSNLKQFKISPELMISDSIPKTAKALQIGSGLGNTEKEEIKNAINLFEDWFMKAKNPAAVIDADMFSYNELPALIKKFNSVKNGRIVLTPHAKELSLLAKNFSLTEEKEITPEEALGLRIQIGKSFTKKYPNAVLVMKGANTFIAEKGSIYVFDKGAQSLAKGGSGDVLAGMITSLLAQGYSAKDAAITAVWRHGTAALEYGKEAFNLTAKKLISLL